VNRIKPMELCQDSQCGAENAPAIETKDLCVRIGERTIVKDVNYVARACSINTIIGPSGSGKTTFLQALNRMLDFVPETVISGSVKVAGADIYDRRIDVTNLRRNVGMIFQKPCPFPTSIIKNLTLPLHYNNERRAGDPHEIAELCLRKVGLWDDVKDRLDASALVLSGGQQQRLCIARALIVNPQILLLDEPCGSLDPISTSVIESLLKELKKSYTVVVVTHNLAQARRIADRTSMFWCANGYGSIIEEGQSETLFANAHHEMTRAFIDGVLG
jgi:phosphate transport system ATP-binding protein